MGHAAAARLQEPAAGRAEALLVERLIGSGADLVRKQAGHLLAKMRYVAAPWAALLESGAWLRNAGRANALARRLEAELRGVPGLRLLYPVEANAVFVQMPPG